MSTSIARIGILSPVTEAGIKIGGKSSRRGTWGTRLRREGRNIEFVWRFGNGQFCHREHCFYPL